MVSLGLLIGQSFTYALSFQFLTRVTPLQRFERVCIYVFMYVRNIIFLFFKKVINGRGRGGGGGGGGGRGREGQGTRRMR